MLADTIITVENLGKCYQLGAGRSNERYTALRDVIADKVKSLFRRDGLISEYRAPISDNFWALKDVSFEVKQGEVVGIIGRNGAGKSTLLKILSRITEPTEGRITIKGRVASLLEVGTGFHPELTGRENIYLNGAILGMHRSEIKAKFDEIVAFAEVAKFLDTPVKRYSSGMYVRLAFAVAAHLEPEILIVDEVLAVGDTEFQKKCLGKMHDVAQGGRTVLFVSHNMGAIKDLCDGAMMLQSGRIFGSGRVEKIVNDYLLTGSNRSGIVRLTEHSLTKNGKAAFFHSVAILNPAEEVTSAMSASESFSLEVVYEVPRPLKHLEIGIRISTGEGRPVMTSLMSEVLPDLYENSQQGKRRVRVLLPGNFLMPGSYLVQNVALFEPHGQIYDSFDDILSFDIEDTGTIFTRYRNNAGIGVVMRTLPWTSVALEP